MIELREELRSMDKDFNKRMALVEFLLYHFQVLTFILTIARHCNSDVTTSRKQ